MSFFDHKSDDKDIKTFDVKIKNLADSDYLQPKLDKSLNTINDTVLEKLRIDFSKENTVTGEIIYDCQKYLDLRTAVPSYRSINFEDDSAIITPLFNISSEKQTGFESDSYDRSCNESDFLREALKEEEELEELEAILKAEREDFLTTRKLMNELKQLSSSFLTLPSDLEIYNDKVPDISSNKRNFSKLSNQTNGKTESFKNVEINSKISEDQQIYFNSYENKISTKLELDQTNEYKNNKSGISKLSENIKLQSERIVDKNNNELNKSTKSYIDTNIDDTISNVESETSLSLECKISSIFRGSSREDLKKSSNCSDEDYSEMNINELTKKRDIVFKNYQNSDKDQFRKNEKSDLDTNSITNKKYFDVEAQDEHITQVKNMNSSYSDFKLKKNSNFLRNSLDRNIHDQNSPEINIKSINKVDTVIHNSATIYDTLFKNSRDQISSIDETLVTSVNSKGLPSTLEYLSALKEL